MNKSDFPIFENNPELVYLDNAATSQKPQVVIDAITDFYTHTNANVHRGIHTLAEEATILYENSRYLISNFLGVDSSEIIFTSGTTESINLIAQMLFEHYISSKSRKKTILISEMEHHANLIPWQELAQRLDWDIEYVRVKDNYELDENDLSSKLKPETAIIALSHMSNVLGTIIDATSICKKAKAVNPEIITVIDGAQYIPHHKLDLGSSKDIDFYCFSGHKMLGPTGIGVLYGKKEILEQLEPAKFGGGMISKVERDSSSWAELPEMLEAGTPNIAGAIGLGAAINYLENLDSKELLKHMHELSKYTLNKLQEIPELKLFYPEKQSSVSTIFSFAVKGIHPHDVAQLVDNDGIAVRAGHHCCQILHREILKVPATTRVSLYFYNENDDIDKLGNSIKSIVTRFR